MFESKVKGPMLGRTFANGRVGLAHGALVGQRVDAAAAPETCGFAERGLDFLSASPERCQSTTRPADRFLRDGSDHTL